ncbi:hypothetical protein CSQ85_01745 [Bifidobacterium rousetti]|uniref:DUF1963 domain-containing protein n=1 Tax=Bifidobacterium rousetti TaxID=2045439 RepID=UPI001239B934|nr:DUF1963 domain-containing protein [Bifidobacterium rousetti]KAA8820528.1 hypothetical protein CSQ85_01745 [Bifidobacterium rousetti]
MSTHNDVTNDVTTIEGLSSTIADMIRERTSIPAVALHVQAADGSAILDPQTLRDIDKRDLASPSLMDTKYGGPYPVPTEWNDPVDADGAPLFLLAQWNFADLPHLDGYPTDGLLQLFIAEDVEAEHPWEIRYLPAPLLSDVRVVAPSWTSDLNDLPFSGPDVTFKLVGAPIRNPMDTSDRGIEDLIDACLDRLGDEARDLYDDNDADIDDLLFELLGTGGHLLGGHPTFTQDDPRDWLDDGDDLVQLAQIDSIEFSMMLGDNGIGHILIPRDALRAWDLSRAVYQWDCY